MHLSNAMRTGFEKGPVMNTLTRDTLLLSRPINRLQRDIVPACAINCTDIASPPEYLQAQVTGLVHDSLAHNSRRAYASDLKRFLNWGGKIPATDIMIANYLAEHAETNSPSTIVRWITSLAKAHRASGDLDPTRCELVRSVVRGIRRRYGAPPDRANPLSQKLLFQVLDEVGAGVKDARDRALLLVGFAGGFRRSELIGLDYADIEFVPAGITLNIRRSKTDQYGEGRVIGIPYARGRHCPVLALRDWLTCSCISEGPLFRLVNRHSQLGSRRLSGEAVSLVVKARLTAIQVDPTRYSGHSLRSGFATSAAQAGAPSWKIRAQTGHASDAMLSKYILDAEMFVDNAAGAIL